MLAVSDPGLPSAARASAASSRAASPSRSPLCLLSTVSRRSLSRLFSRTATRTGTKERKKESDNAWEGWEDGMPSTQGFSGEECGASRRAVAHPRASTSSYLSSQFLANSQNQKRGRRKKENRPPKEGMSTDGRPSENTPAWIASHQSSLPNAAKGYQERDQRWSSKISLKEPREKERKKTATQGRDADGRTARRHHTGILRRGVSGASRRPP